MRSCRSGAVGLAFLLGACASGGRAPHPVSWRGSPPRPVRYDETGIASWYGNEFAGRPTASGTRFEPSALTAAHRTLPLGTVVEVTSLATGEHARVLINDRGPGRTDRLIDLSRGAAQAIGLDRHPLSRVRVRTVAAGDGEAAVLGRQRLPDHETRIPASVEGGAFLVQVAAFADGARAAALARSLGGYVVEAEGLYRVRLGPFASFDDAQHARDAAAARGYGDAVLLQPTEPDRP